MATLRSRFIADLDGTSPEVTTFTVNEAGCHIWNGATTGGGYPELTDTSGKVIYAHRFAYQHQYGGIPKGKQWHIHHQCQTRNCVNADHLRLVHASLHCSMAGKIAAAARTHCASGRHRWIPENLLIIGTKKIKNCRLCREEWLASPAYKNAQKAYRATAPYLERLRKTAAARRDRNRKKRMMDEPGWLPMDLRTKQTVTCMNHPSEKAHCLSMCRKCYQAARAAKKKAEALKNGA